MAMPNNVEYRFKALVVFISFFSRIFYEHWETRYSKLLFESKLSFENHIYALASEYFVHYFP
jgi:hypothetical protein